MAAHTRDITLLNHEDVASLLRRTPDWLYRHRRRLTRDHGFPPPLDMFGQNLWDPMAIRRWLDAQARPALPSPLRTEPPPDRLDPIEVLAQRAADLARGATP